MEKVWFSHRTSSKFADLAKVELFWNCWANSRPPTRVQARNGQSVTRGLGKQWSLGTGEGRGLRMQGMQQSLWKEPVR